MKLISCRITNFGKFADRKFDFGKDLTVLKEDNGFGKTTLADFLVSMFYGLPDKRKKDISENEGLKYDPWQGGVFGGNLVFEYGGKQYCIEREFNKKNNDGFKFYSNEPKRPVNNINGHDVDSSNIGEVLFGISKNSYKRSVYVPQEEIVCTEIESGLNDRLRNLINATNEKFSFDKTVESLKKAEHTISSQRGLGKLKDVSEKIRKLKEQIEECRGCEKNSIDGLDKLKKCEMQLENCNNEINNLDKSIDKKKELEAILEAQKYHTGIRCDIEKNKSEIKSLTPFFKGQDVDNIDLDAIKSAIDDMERQQKTVRDIDDETLQERGRLANIETANTTRQERRNLFNDKLKGLKKDREKYANKKLGILSIILCILTLGLFFLYLKNKNKQNEEKTAQIDDKIRSTEEQIDEITNQLTQNDTGKLAEIKNRQETERVLLRQAEGRVEDMLSKFDCVEKEPTPRFYEIKEKHGKLVGARKKLKDNNGRLTEFLKGNDVSELTLKNVDGISIVELKKERKEKDEERLNLTGEISRLKMCIEQDDETASGISIYESKLDLLKEQEKTLQTEKDYLEKARLFLQDANDNLASRYLTPLKQKSEEIIQTHNLEFAIGFDAYSKVEITEKGKARELNYFSKGTREFVSLTMRFALIDIIFEKNAEKPCVILDDPFANLDEKKLELAKEFIKKLSKKYQIIYLTCHDSRNITA